MRSVRNSDAVLHFQCSNVLFQGKEWRCVVTVEGKFCGGYTGSTVSLNVRRLPRHAYVFQVVLYRHLHPFLRSYRTRYSAIPAACRRADTFSNIVATNLTCTHALIHRHLHTACSRQFLCYEKYRRILAGGDGGKPSKLVSLGAGSTAGVTAVAITYPLDVVRARMALQTEG